MKNGSTDTPARPGRAVPGFAVRLAVLTAALVLLVPF